MWTALMLAAMVPGLILFFLAWKGGRDAYGSAADFLNWGALAAPGVVVCKDGSFLAGWEIRGLDTESLEPQVLEAILQRFARGISNLGAGDCIWMRLDRRPFEAMELPKGRDHLPALGFMIRDIEAQLLGDELYKNALHLCWQHRPKDTSAPIAEQLEEFERLANALPQRLGSALAMRRLGRKNVERALGADFTSDELVDQLASNLNGRTRTLRQPANPEHLYLDSLLAVSIEQSDLNSFLTVDGRRCAVLSIEGLPAEYPDEVLAELEQINFEYTWVSRFQPQSSAQTRATVKNLRRQWRQSAADVSAQVGGTSTGDRDPHADAMVMELEHVERDLGRPGAVYGNFASTLLIFAPQGSSEQEFFRKIEAINASLQDAGFMMRAESHSALEVFLASVPGHAHRRPRDVYISARNFADLMPVRTLWKGEEYCPSPLFPKRSPSLMLARTSTGELFRFNLHNEDLGHTLIFGPSGGGKSVLLGALAANFLKYNHAQVIFFDKQRSVQRASQIFGGTFTSFEPEGRARLSPLSDTPRLGRQWAADWLRTMAELGGVHMTRALLDEIDNAVSNMAQMGEYSLQNVCNFVTSADLRRAFEAHTDSFLGDAAPDTQKQDLVWSDFTVFETNELFDAGNEARMILALDYIFASVSLRFTGQPTLLIIDEAHAFLAHDIFAKRIDTWIKEARKSNVAVVLATQTLADVQSSSLLPVLMDNCQTKIFLPNGGAKTDDASNQYRALGLNNAQIDLISSLVPKRDYYLIKPGVSRVVDFAFGPATLQMIGKTSRSDSKDAAARFEKNHKYWVPEVIAALEGTSGEDNGAQAKPENHAPKLEEAQHVGE